jgi:hypothetical protein
MDKLIVERALRALAEIGAVRLAGIPTLATVASPVPTAHAIPGETTAERDELAPCGSSRCAGCYDVGDGKKIHPPKTGKDYQKRMERWPSGMVQ